MAAVKFQWQQTMLRVKDAAIAVPFFEKHFGMTLLDRLDFPQWKFSLYFLASVKGGEAAKAALPKPGTTEAHEKLWHYPGVVLELTHNWETREGFSGYKTGNSEGGFGHIAFFADGDIGTFCEKLEAEGVRFKKRLTEGRMRNIAFAYSDPDDYWIEIITHGEIPDAPKLNLCQTMYRIRDPKVSIPFYRDVLGMTLVCERHFPDAKFSLYFLACLDEGVTPPADPASPEAPAFLKTLWNPVLELTYNHPNPDVVEVHPGNALDDGYGHIGFVVDDLPAAVQYLDSKGVRYKKRVEDGNMHNLAFIYDPDNYLIEIYSRKFE